MSKIQKDLTKAMHKGVEVIGKLAEADGPADRLLGVIAAVAKAIQLGFARKVDPKELVEAIEEAEKLLKATIANNDAAVDAAIDVKFPRDVDLPDPAPDPAPAHALTYTYTYSVEWSVKDQAHVATCAAFPSLSCVSTIGAGAALSELMLVVDDTITDMIAKGEPLPQQPGGGPEVEPDQPGPITDVEPEPLEPAPEPPAG